MLLLAVILHAFLSVSSVSAAPGRGRFQEISMQRGNIKAERYNAMRATIRQIEPPSIWNGTRTYDPETNQEFCLYQNNVYKLNETWLDMRICKFFICIPQVYFSFRMELVPMHLPQDCVAFTSHRRNRRVRRLGRCIAPLVQRRSSGRNPIPCRNRNLRTMLSRNTWVVSRNRDTRMKAHAIPDRNSNMKRSSDRSHHHDHVINPVPINEDLLKEIIAQLSQYTA